MHLPLFLGVQLTFQLSLLKLSFLLRLGFSWQSPVCDFSGPSSTIYPLCPTTHSTTLCARKLKEFTLFYSFPSILSVSMNPTRTLLHLCKSLESLLCDRIALIPRMVLSRDDSHTSGSVVIFVGQDLSFPELLTSSLASLGSYSRL